MGRHWCGREFPEDPLRHASTYDSGTNVPGCHLPRRWYPAGTGQGFTDKLSKLNHQAVWTSGVEHPWLDEKIPQHQGEIDSAARRELAIEITTFMFENALTNIGLYNFDVVWPVGPRIQPWSEGVRYRDLRNINGYEYIRAR